MTRETVQRHEPESQEPMRSSEGGGHAVRGLLRGTDFEAGEAMLAPLDPGARRGVQMSRRGANVQMDERAAHDELMGISSNVPEGGVKQDAESFEQLYGQAVKAQEELGALTQKIAAAAGATAIVPQVKTEKRAWEKIKGDFAGDFSAITDLARTTIMCDSLESLVKAYRLLEAQTKIEQVKNRFAIPKKGNMYRDMNLLVRLPGTGHVGEVQLHLQKIQDVKSGPEHDIYARIQTIERAAKLDNDRALTKEEREEIERLQAESKKLYEDAWSYYYERAMGGGQ